MVWLDIAYIHTLPGSAPPSLRTVLRIPPVGSGPSTSKRLTRPQPLTTTPPPHRRRLKHHYPWSLQIQPLLLFLLLSLPTTTRASSFALLTNACLFILALFPFLLLQISAALIPNFCNCPGARLLVQLHHTCPWTHLPHPPKTCLMPLSEPGLHPGPPSILPSFRQLLHQPLLSTEALFLPLSQTQLHPPLGFSKCL